MNVCPKSMSVGGCTTVKFGIGHDATLLGCGRDKAPWMHGMLGSATVSP